MVQPNNLLNVLFQMNLLEQKFKEEKIPLLTSLCSSKADELNIFNVSCINLLIKNRIIKCQYFTLFMTKNTRYLFYLLHDRKKMVKN